MARICAHLNISRQAYYQQRAREARRGAKAEKILAIVRMVRRRHPRMGTRKLLVKIRPWLAQEGLSIGRDRLFELLREHDLLVPRRRRRRRTTQAGAQRAPNLLKGRAITRPDEAWVADITYLDIAPGGFVYLFLIMDLYSRYIVGWSLASSLSAEPALAALQMALHQMARSPQEIIHHSDHGVQYTSHSYERCLRAHGLQPSMGEVGNAYDNAYAERVLGTLKQEYALDSVFKDLHEASIAVAEAVHLYNTDRPHLSLEYATPGAVYQNTVAVETISAAPARRPS